MKITEIKNRRGKVRVTSDGEYYIGGIKIVAQEGIPHNIVFSADYPDI